jgi:hypothetical protein
VPWSGGARVVSPYEAAASEVASALAGRPVSIECHSEVSWERLAGGLGVNPARSWAITPYHSVARDRIAPDDVAHFSPRACRFADAFWRAPAELGTRTCFMRVPVGRLRQTQPKGECGDWSAKLTAVHVLSHESMHLYGFYGEANAECLGVQLDAYVAVAFGADERFARSLAREYWSDYYVPRDDAYRSLACREGGGLDLFPTRRGWPTPSAYPADLGAALAAMERRIRAGGGSP